MISCLPNHSFVPTMAVRIPSLITCLGTVPMRDDQSTQMDSGADVAEQTARIQELERRLAEAEARCAEREQEVVRLRSALAQDVKVLGILNALMEITPAWVFIKDQQHRYHSVSRSYADALHIAPEQFVGKDDLEIGFPPELVKGDPARGIRGFWTDDRQVMDSGKQMIYPHDPATVDGTVHIFHTIKCPLTDANGQIWAVLGLAQDVTRVAQAEQALKQSLAEQQVMINSQQELILELSTPLIPVHDGVVIMPIIGVVDTTRAGKILETLLEGIGRHHAITAILDITGVKSVDTHVANALVQAAKAARLLGTEVILTGITAAVAQTIVSIGIDLSSIDTQSTLQQGIARALSRRRNGFGSR